MARSSRRRRTRTEILDHRGPCCRSRLGRSPARPREGARLARSSGSAAPAASRTARQKQGTTTLISPELRRARIGCAAASDTAWSGCPRSAANRILVRHSGRVRCGAWRDAGGTKPSQPQEPVRAGSALGPGALTPGPT
jgi:hypothetical protein